MADMVDAVVHSVRAFEMIGGVGLDTAFQRRAFSRLLEAFRTVLYPATRWWNCYMNKTSPFSPEIRYGFFVLREGTDWSWGGKKPQKAQ